MKQGLFMNGRVETSPSSGRETYTMPAPRRDHVSQDQILEVLGGPSLLSASRSGGLFQDNPDSSIRHKAPVNINESADEENDDRNLPSEVTVDIDRAGQSHHAEFTDSTNPKLLFGDSLGSDSCSGRETLLGRLPSNVTDDNEDEISVDHDSREFTSGEQSDHNYGMSHLIDSAYSSGDGGQSRNGEQRTGTDELQTGAGELQTGAGELQTGPDMQQKGTDLQQDVEGAQNVLGDSSTTSERCGKTVASHDVEDHHPHGPLRDGEASGGEESGTSVLNPAQNAGGCAGIALGRWAARAFAMWELIQYY
ncbi:uncharacterized protein LOC135468295 isoform X2 [Liolophura sinensis]|uniref:uncharacterized protein LOC135468295 isoform X2 n=1 Tax=Liolophura sinensis TaxID=3198878 RepID=UPI0031596A22